MLNPNFQKKRQTFQKLNRTVFGKIGLSKKKSDLTVGKAELFLENLTFCILFLHADDIMRLGGGAQKWGHSHYAGSLCRGHSVIMTLHNDPA